MKLLMLIELFVTGGLVFLSAAIIYKAPIWRYLVLASVLSIITLIVTIAIWVYTGGGISLSFDQAAGILLYIVGIFGLSREQYRHYKKTQKG